MARSLFNPLRKLFNLPSHSRNKKPLVASRNIVLKHESLSSRATTVDHDGLPLLTDSSSIPKRYRQRTQLVAEILATEKSYLSYMYVAESCLLRLVNASIQELDLTLQQYISLRHLAVSLSQLRTASKSTTLAMMKRVVAKNVTNWRDERSLDIRYWKPSSSSFGDVMLDVLPNMSVFTEYVMKFQEYVTNITNAMAASPRFRSMIEKCQRLPEMNHLTVTAVLLMPVQRIPRYRLLLQNLLAATSRSHPDYKNIQRALDQYEALAKTTNEKLRLKENTRAIKSIEEKMAGTYPPLDVPGRELLLQGRLIKACRLGNETKQFYIFSDMLMYANFDANRQLVFRNAFQLEGLKVIDIPSSESPNVTLGLGLFVLFDKTTPFSFLILSPNRSFQVFCKTQHEKEAWMEKLKAAIIARKRAVAEEKKLERDVTCESISETNETNSLDEGKGQLAPIWVPDFASSSCMICEALFTIINRRHHCRLCGKICCNACSLKKSPIQRNANVQQERVCDPCYEDIHDAMTISMISNKSEPGHLIPSFKNFFQRIKI